VAKDAGHSMSVQNGHCSFRGLGAPTHAADQQQGQRDWTIPHLLVRPNAQNELSLERGG
jgi:hypothetical protein